MNVRNGLVLIFALSSVGVAHDAFAEAENFKCGEGKPDAKSGKCICPPGQVEKTEAKVSKCIVLPKPSPPSASTTKPPPLPTATATATAPTPAGLKCLPGMIAIPGGKFPFSGSSDVTVAPFCLDKTEVTVAAYDACVLAGKCTEPLKYRADTPSQKDCNWKHPDRNNHPINCVDYGQAIVFCKQAGKRQPMGQEWEWATRGLGKANDFPWGDDAPGSRTCWNGEGNSLGKGKRTSTCSVGAFAQDVTPQGVLDLAGNVSEFVNGPYSNSHRGGNWNSESSEDMGSHVKKAESASGKNPWLGFRCALGAPTIPF